MTTVGPELTSFIDPSLTWKTVSKGRNTSRRSRRSASKNMKMVQEHDKRIPKRSNSLQCSESEKSNVMLHGRRFPSNMEHIPIKKRRLFIRSPSPPTHSPNHQEESEGLVGGQCISDQLNRSNVTIECQAKRLNFSLGSNSNCDGIIGENSVKSLNDNHGLREDFSGIAILAAAACSDRLDNSSDDAGKSQSQMGGLLDREQNEYSVSASDVKENVTCIQSPDLVGKDTEHVGNCTVDYGSQVVSMEGGDVDDAGMSPIKKVQEVEQNDIVASTSVSKESVEFLGLPDLLRSDAVRVNKESFADSSNEVADRISENSIATRDCRFHWDLNTVMDDWDEPLDDTGFSSSTQLVEVAPLNITGSQNLVDGDVSEAKRFEIQDLEEVEGLETKRSEATVSDDRGTSQAEFCTGPEIVALPNNAGVTSVIVQDNLTFSRMEHCSEVLSGFATSILKENSSPSHANNPVMEPSLCVTNSEIQPEVVNEDAKTNHSLSLGLNATKASASEEVNNGSGSENLNEAPEETSRLSMQIVKSEESVDRGIGFLLAPLLGKASSEVKDADCKHTEDSEVRNVSDENDIETVTLTCQSTATQSLGSNKCEFAALDASKSGEISCRVNDLNCRTSEPPKQISLVDGEVKHEEIIGQPLDSQPSSSENLLVESKDSSVSLCSGRMTDRVTASMTTGADQAVDRLTANETEENPTVTDCSESEALVPKMLDHCVAVDPFSKPTGGQFTGKSLGGVCGIHVSNEFSSQVTENAGTVTELEGGYDSHLEDGELRESHCWEDNEGEDGETEHVDYDSDNRDGVVFYEAANDYSVQLSGEVLAGECEKQSCRSDNFSSADDQQPKLDKSIEENCSLHFQGCLSTVDEAVYTKRESSVLKACSTANNSDKGDMDHKDCRSSIEINCTGKEFDNDLPRNTRGASASGRDLQFLDRRCADSMRRSRSSNFDCMHHTEGPDDSLTRSQQQTSMQMGRFGGRSWNPDLKSTVANSSSEDGERILRASGDTSPFRGPRPRIINTSARSGYHFVRRGSPGERDSDYGMGMVKTRGVSPDINPRNRFGRFNGINRGFREGYRRPGVYEGLKSGGGGPMMNRFSKRDRSFSPAGDRFQRKSRSRSRTRSPDFRPETRMGRGRLPYQQANHVGEHTRGRRTPARVFHQNHRFDVNGSPGRMRSDECMKPTMRPMRFHDTTTSGRGQDFEDGDNYRRKLLMRNRRRSRSRSRSCSPEFRSDARMGPMRAPYQPSGDHIRDRRSPPVRVFRPDQRYEGVGSPPVRLRSDECLRPKMRPLRFPDTAQPGRGHEFNNNNNGDDIRRKPRNIFERIHPGRHYDVEGDVRRFQYDSEEGVPPTQNFRRNENFARGGERRPVEFRGPREERGNVRFNNNNNNNNSNNSERVFYTGPKQFGGMRDHADDGLPRRARQ